MATKKTSGKRALGQTAKKKVVKKTVKRSAGSASSAKKTSKKKVESKKSAAKKSVQKTASKVKVGVRKGVAAKKPSKKVPGKKVPATRGTAKKAGVAKAKGPEAKKAKTPKTPVRKKKHLTAKELRGFRQLLLNLRDKVVDDINFLTGDNLNAKQIERTGEEGTDNFTRESALHLVSADQDIIYEIDAALRRLRNGTYGLCEVSGDPIEKERLKVLPHARHSVAVQSGLEKGRARYRPFGPGISRS